MDNKQQLASTLTTISLYTYNISWGRTELLCISNAKRWVHNININVVLCFVCIYTVCLCVCTDACDDLVCMFDLCFTLKRFLICSGCLYVYGMPCTADRFLAAWQYKPKRHIRSFHIVISIDGASL